MVVVDVGAEQASQVSLVAHNDVVETLATDRADHTLDVRMLLGRAGRRAHGCEADISDESPDTARDR